MSNENSISSIIAAGAAMIIIPAAILCAIVSYNTVESTERAVITRFGKIHGDVVTPGLNFKAPFVDSITYYTVGTQRVEGKTAAYTKDLQTAEIKYIYTVNLSPEVVQQIHQTVGRDWHERLVPQVVDARIKEIVAKWNADKLVESRAEAANDIRQSIFADLQPKGVILSGIEIINVDYSDAYEKAIEAKVIATQNAVQSQNKTVQIQEEAKQQVIKAKAEADATLLNAKAEAEALKIKSEALASSPKLIEYEGIRKWDGKLPQIMLGDKGTPFINVQTVK